MIQLRTINDTHEIIVETPDTRYDFIIAEFPLVFQVFRLQNKEYNVTIQRLDIMNFMEDHGLRIDEPLLNVDFMSIMDSINGGYEDPLINAIAKICNCSENSALARVFACVEIMRVIG